MVDGSSSGSAELVVSEVFGPTVQGEGPSLGRRAAFVRLGRCNLDCSWCFEPTTPVLLADWRWRSIGELRPGDRVVGRTPPVDGRHGRLVPATVTAVGRRHAPLVDVGALRCTPDHQVWLAGDRSHRSGWRAIERAAGARVTFLAAPAKEDDTAWALGWLAGMADGDGCFWSLRTGGRRPYRRFRLALTEPRLLDRFETLAADAGFTLRRGHHTASGFGPQTRLDCLWLTVDGEALAFEALLAADGNGDDWAWGYLGGIIDAEGSLSSNVLRISQSPTASGPTLQRILRVLDRLDLAYVPEASGVRVSIRAGALFEILSRARPAKPSIVAGGFDRAPNHARPMPPPVEVGEGEVVAIATDIGNYIAAGFLVKNCDTPFTWDWERFDPAVELRPMAVDEVVAAVAAMGVDRVVVTGGEPLLQQRRLVPFLEAARARGWAVEVETNGTFAPSPEVAALVERFNVSPKLANSGVPEDRRVVPSALAAFVELAAAGDGRAAFKFVATSVADLDEIAGLVEAHRLAPVWVMPEGTTAEAVVAGGRRLADEVIARGWSFSTRLHVLLWGDERGR